MLFDDAGCSTIQMLRKGHFGLAVSTLDHPYEK